ncbi:MAG: hypothetical protein U0350_25930 [Caldilineaceae bacterium]
MNRMPILLLVSLLSMLLGACQFPIVARQVEPSRSTAPLSFSSGIYSPTPESTVSGTIDVVGSATVESFQKYELFYKQQANADDAYIYFGGGTTPIENSKLGAWPTAGLAHGQYTLRLRVVKNTGDYTDFYVANLNVK